MPMFDSTKAHMPVGTIVPTNTNMDQLVTIMKKNVSKESEKMDRWAYRRHPSVAVAKGEGSARQLQYRRCNENRVSKLG